MVEDELKELVDAYEQALQANDIAVLDRFFWDSPKTVRFGQGENLFGIEEIRTFRAQRPEANLARDRLRMECIVLDEDHGIVNLIYTRSFDGVLRNGRQTQVWKLFNDVGWKIVSAHVSLLQEGF